MTVWIGLDWIGLVVCVAHTATDRNSPFVFGEQALPAPERKQKLESESSPVQRLSPVQGRVQEEDI